MATQPTQDAVPSESQRDLKFNAGKIDEFVTSLVNTYIDRFGNEHYTIEGLRWLAQQAIAEFGWIPIGTFQAGATLTLPNQILKDETDGEYYRWDGSFPKTVPVGSTPSTSGGIGTGAWLSVGDATVRQWVKTNYDESTYQQIQTGNFATGTTVTSSFQVVYYPTDGHWYRYLGSVPAGGLTVSAGSAPDSNWENINKQQMVSLRKLNVLSTASIAGYIGVNIDMPVSVTDSDNQGVHIDAGVTIRNDVPTQNKINTTKLQSALNLFGNNISLIGLKGQGTADSTNSATSEFITGRGAWAIGSTLDNIYIDGVQVEGYTTAIDVMNAKNWRIRNVKFKGMCYGGSGLGYAGGYGILTQAGVDGLDIDGVYHTLVFGKDRHCLYVSESAPVSSIADGWQNVTVKNIFCDWRANNNSNVDPTNGILFAMSPIHVRTGKGLSIDGVTVIGMAGAAIDLENQRGPISDVTIRNVVARDLVSYANGSITDTGAIRVGYNQYTNTISNVSISGCDLKIKRGSGMATNSDHCVILDRVTDISVSDCKLTVETGSSILIRDSNNITIDRITDTMTDVTSSLPVIEIIGCSNVFIGDIRTNRGTIANDKTVTFSGACTDITCAFPRLIAFTVTNGVVSSISDRWGLLAGVPTFSGFTVVVPIVGHVTQASVDGCRLQLDTISSAGIVKVSTANKIVTIGCVNTTSGAGIQSNTITSRVEIHFSR